MSVATDTLPLQETVAPADSAELAAIVAESFRTGTPLYPLGGRTSLDYGLTPKTTGQDLSLEHLNRVVDYPARDMTITVEAGITMVELARLMAAERQRLPIDAPEAGQATLGGVIATNTSGPRRFAHGTIRDYVIGISAVDGRGMPFKAGGRVVKNVAGYDFCKLLTGSLGTLGVITQVTLKVKPIPEASAFLLTEIPNSGAADQLLAGLVTSQVTPTAVELLAGPAWSELSAIGPLANADSRIALIGLEGTRREVEWMLEQLQVELREQQLSIRAITEADRVSALWNALTEFPASRNSPLVVKANLRPSRTVAFVDAAREIDPRASIQAHAGNGIVVARFAEPPAGGLSAVLIKRLQPLARAGQGNVVVLSSTGGSELTRQAVWGFPGPDARLMTAVKRQFDPKGLLNPGRFVY